MYGIDKHGEHLVDKQTNLNLCDGAEYCNDSTLTNKIHKIKVLRQGLYQKYAFKNCNTSRGHKAFILRSIDFFGITGQYRSFLIRKNFDQIRLFKSIPIK